MHQSSSGSPPGIPVHMIGWANECHFLLEGIRSNSLLDTGSTVSTTSHLFFQECLLTLLLYSLDDILNVECAGGQMLGTCLTVKWTRRSSHPWTVSGCKPSWLSTYMRERKLPILDEVARSAVLFLIVRKRQLNDSVEQITANIQSKPTIARKPKAVTCYICKKEGHHTLECRNNNVTRQTVGKGCVYCGETTPVTLVMGYVSAPYGQSFRRFSSNFELLFTEGDV